MREYVIDINGVLDYELTNGIVEELRSVYEHNKYFLNTYVNPDKNIIHMVTLNINSPGGDVAAFGRIKTEIDKLKSLNVVIKTHVTYMAASCAFLILLLGTVRSGEDTCELMNHVATRANYGKVTENKRRSDFALKMEDKYNKFIADNTNLSIEYLEENSDIDMWFDYDDAVKYGIFTKGYTEEDVTIKLSDLIEEYKSAGYTVVDDINDKKKTKKKKED